ncbi:hypothetical protein L1987_36977 [Smallanthus sonchifolius]|uniref:Uncharacterized protein n=1 Tax=Smallanthus sonchifolius TaxID=185202 RepID=A0ACB9HF21_9ASTR|nr:hypothetical protein L1987_36977 [Smallanthus sonchifolius]
MSFSFLSFVARRSQSLDSKGVSGIIYALVWQMLKRCMFNFLSGTPYLVALFKKMYEIRMQSNTEELFND